MKIFTIIAAGGSGQRMGQPKQLLPICGKPMLEWTVDAFKQVSEISGIVIVGPGQGLSPLVCETGPERTDSVRNALALVPKDCDIVLIHDGARPLITPEIIKNSIEECKKQDAVVVGVPVKDTIKQMTNDKCFDKLSIPKSSSIPSEVEGCQMSNKSCNHQIGKTLERERLWAAQTPQVFKYSILKEAYKKAKAGATDDSKLVEDLGIPVKMVMGSYENIKVTTPEDIIIAEAILCSRRQKKNL
ncbi:MAG: 2-C-methyl-D-erythritol 4-phosphate cytidylyltransferase [Candidatus Saganbacteria bacterium]|nr:2-C-methyl-D-erythritol 4-phosphate cytidylyltransferase [Candidatus Saganbacteria bacterium]